MSIPKNDPTVAIVGGGATGAAVFERVVARLARDACGRPRPRLVLLEKSERIGPGLAYARDASPYLLNQGARTMSLLRAHRPHFREWLEARGLARAGSDELVCARQLFGDYVEEFFARAVDEARRHGLAVSTLRDEVTSLTARRSGGYHVGSRAHPPIDADVVVLALGNLPSTRFRALDGPGFVASPYPGGTMCARVPRDARVAILGTGLSAIDAALALFAAGHRAPVTMASRSGMLPAVRGPLEPHELRHVTRASVARATEHGRAPLRWSTLARWLELELASRGPHERREPSLAWERDFPAWRDPLVHLEAQIAASERGARAWQAIGEALNPMIEVLWHHLHEDDRRVFLDRFYSRFMSHWVSIPLVTARRVLGLLRERQLTVERGLLGVTRDKRDTRRCVLALRFPDRVAEHDVVIDATGAPRSLAECDSPLVRALLEEGTILPHPFGGLRVDFDSMRVLGQDGRAGSSLFALGQLTFGTHLFTSSLEANLEKAERVAAHVVHELHRRSDQEPHVDPAPHSA